MRGVFWLDKKKIFLQQKMTNLSFKTTDKIP